MSQEGYLANIASNALEKFHLIGGHQEPLDTGIHEVSCLLAYLLYSLW